MSLTILRIPGVTNQATARSTTHSYPPVKVAAGRTQGNKVSGPAVLLAPSVSTDAANLWSAENLSHNGLQTVEIMLDAAEKEVIIPESAKSYWHLMKADICKGPCYIRVLPAPSNTLDVPDVYLHIDGVCDLVKESGPGFRVFFKVELLLDGDVVFSLESITKEKRSHGLCDLKKCEVKDTKCRLIYTWGAAAAYYILDFHDVSAAKIFKEQVDFVLDFDDCQLEASGTEQQPPTIQEPLTTPTDSPQLKHNAVDEAHKSSSPLAPEQEVDSEKIKQQEHLPADAVAKAWQAPLANSDPLQEDTAQLYRKNSAFIEGNACLIDMREEEGVQRTLPEIAKYYLNEAAESVCALFRDITAASNSGSGSLGKVMIPFITPAQVKRWAAGGMSGPGEAQTLQLQNALEQLLSARRASNDSAILGSPNMWELSKANINMTPERIRYSPREISGLRSSAVSKDEELSKLGFLPKSKTSQVRIAKAARDNWAQTEVIDQDVNSHHSEKEPQSSVPPKELEQLNSSMATIDSIVPAFRGLNLSPESKPFVPKASLIAPQSPMLSAANSAARGLSSSRWATKENGHGGKFTGGFAE